MKSQQCVQPVSQRTHQVTHLSISVDQWDVPLAAWFSVSHTGIILTYLGLEAAYGTVGRAEAHQKGSLCICAKPNESHFPSLYVIADLETGSLYSKYTSI